MLFRDSEPHEVALERLFLMGDNRENSNDSRFWGTVHASHLIGPATGVYLSGGLPTWRSLAPEPVEEPDE